MMECPFCGVPTASPHESQEACIVALQAEIDRLRGVVGCLRSAAVPEPSDGADDLSLTSPACAGEDEEPQY